MTLAVLVMVTATITSGCGFAPSGSANIARTLPGGVRSALTNGIESAVTTFDGYTDDFAKAAEPTAIAPPPALQQAVRRADEAVANGVRLTQAEQRLLDTAERWIAAYKAWDRVLEVAIGWELSIPDDAVRLAAANFIREPSQDFLALVVALEERVLKGLMCTVAREGLDGLGEIQARSEPAAYEYVGTDSTEVAAYLDAAVASVPGAFDVLDTLGLANESIDLANDYLDGLVDVIDSPSTSVATANLIYFRSCVARPR
ncbi:hypothetical protein [Agromyces binzhouensis]|uniref:Uncharacterized protein n=1 Tax=Agromyces binzhouensis TaxID=1817495 RepID=A0A4Q2JMZ0_9MICO|nr:hypothetical protein [Agromyces binzhouensis]RXZ48344.1 hypothetical protein ESO86_06955 [Agromyces binzhouensis]